MIGHGLPSAPRATHSPTPTQAHPLYSRPGADGSGAQPAPHSPGSPSTEPVLTVPRRWPLHSSLELGPLPGATPCARLHARLVLREWNLAHLTEPAELLVSELVTNAIHASQAAGTQLPVRFVLLSDREQLVIQVHDASPSPPLAAHAADTEESGRGLILVEAISAAWDWYPQTDGKVVRAILEARP